MVARHTEAKRQAFARMHGAAVRKLVFEGLTRAGDSKIRQFSEQWRIGYEIGQKHLAEEIQAIFGAPPKGYSEIEPSLKTKAKNRYLDWREMQAKGEWKKLSPEEQARWEAYVTENVPFETIREKELNRSAEIAEGDQVKIIHSIEFWQNTYPVGLVGEVAGIIYHSDSRSVISYCIEFGGDLPNVNAYPHEIKRVSGPDA